jgi:type IV pilus assembly protein PilW
MRTHAQRGFSLIEAMVSITVSLLLLSGFITVFMGSSSSYRKNDRNARLNDELSLGMAHMTEDIEMAGFWADLLDSALITVDNSATPGVGSLTTAPGNECFSTAGATYSDRSALAAVDNNTSASPTAVPCISDAYTARASDILVVKRLNGSPTRGYDGARVTNYQGLDATGSPPTLTVGRVYVRTNGNFYGSPTPSAPTVGAMFLQSAAATTGPVNAVTNIPSVAGNGNGTAANSYSDWEFRTVVYYIRSFSNVSGDGIPSLCRKTLQGGSPPTMVTECFAQGVETLQVEFGIDTGTDGIPDYYASAPALTSTQIANACAVRVSMVGRSVDLNPSTFDQFSGQTADYTNAKTYTVANLTAFTPADNLFRRVISQAIVVRNPTTLRVVINRS